MAFGTHCPRICLHHIYIYWSGLTATMQPAHAAAHDCTCRQWQPQLPPQPLPQLRCNFCGFDHMLHAYLQGEGVGGGMRDSRRRRRYFYCFGCCSRWSRFAFALSNRPPRTIQRIMRHRCPSSRFVSFPRLVFTHLCTLTYIDFAGNSKGDCGQWRC